MNYIINEDRINNIYMLRQDGKLFDLKGLYIHPLLNPSWDKIILINNLYNIIADLGWYYKNCTAKTTKDNIYHLVTMLLYYNPSALAQAIRCDIFIDEDDIYKEEPFDIEGLYEHVAFQCAQEFLKIRFGGAYNTNIKSRKDVYFRVASTGFNWFNLIWEFVVQHESEIQTITIVRDKELTGEEEYYEINNKKIKNYPVDKFINVKGTPIIESKNNFGISLGLGATLEEAYGVPNHRHIVQQLNFYKKEDTTNWKIKLER